ncbi:S8 family serine peptidase [Pseudoalteromonas luteoviolacea]|uniref:S8 family serine peptidase n=1 Tax=Pseudoalteromonas luteoviolacea TaxID=43657 RepID=UPI001154BD81|nr:S8 family serine peptidase [Pseudoalteromonas luteoviolacea]TQF68008.1 S8 family serine peptidase [Pseudoalteromonas luteoviolacea]
MTIRRSPIILAISALSSFISIAQPDSKQYIVKVKDFGWSQRAYTPIDPARAASFVSARLEQIAAQSELHIQKKLTLINAMSIKLTEQQFTELASKPDIEFIELDPIRLAYAEETPYGVVMTQANLVSPPQTSTKKVCVIDSGYSYGHPDLPTHNVTGASNFGRLKTGDWRKDGLGHGTHVAGTIAALGGNDIGVVGIHGNAPLKLHISKVFNDAGHGAYGSDIIAAIEDCLAQGGLVTNMSLGGPHYSQAEQLAFERTYQQGMIHVAAAGNNGTSIKSYPASYTNVISVAAVDSKGEKARFSQFNEAVELAAPGVQVKSTSNDLSYKLMSGTSMASPHVAGIATLLWNKHPDCSNVQLRDALQFSAADKGDIGRDHEYGYGIIQAHDADRYLHRVGCGSSNGSLPVVDFEYAISLRSVTFSEQSHDDKQIVAFLWDFGDGQQSTHSNPVHEYRNDGQYRVSLMVTDSDNQTRIRVQQIIIDSGLPPQCEGHDLWLPNVSYQIGDVVFYLNYKYQAVHWGAGIRPDRYPHLWQKLGRCYE